MDDDKHYDMIWKYFMYVLFVIRLKHANDFDVDEKDQVNKRFIKCEIRVDQCFFYGKLFYEKKSAFI